MQSANAFVSSELSALRCPVNAQEMARYMKTPQPFYGVKAPERKRICSDLKRQFPVADRDAYEAQVLALWQLPHREEQYLAIDIAQRYRAFIQPDSLPLYERMIREGGWWDLVDGVASNLVGGVIDRFPEQGWATVDPWIEADNLWIRRTALICQIRRKERTDADRLFRFCLQTASETDFFIRKAIGWALRAYAGAEPERVRDWLVLHQGELSGLSLREASRPLKKKGLWPS